MASNSDQKLPPQKQEKQPGKEPLTSEPLNHNYNPSNKLDGKFALVTGGDSGIGRSVCYHFALEGATVAFTYVKGQEGKAASDILETLLKLKKKESKDPIGIPTDLGYEENCKKVVDAVGEVYGRIDILVNNAALQHEKSSVEDITEEKLQKVFKANIFAYIFMARHVLKYMREGSVIINTASVNAYKGDPKILDYTSTKGAIVSFTRGLALELVNKGIRVNGVAPGPVWTPAQVATSIKDKMTGFGSETPMGRAAQPHEIGPCYVYLACEESSYYTGQVLHPNGGMIVNA